MGRLATKCTKIYNACKAIIPLIKPFVLRCFHCRCGLCKVHAVVVSKSHNVNFSVFCLHFYLRFKPGSYRSQPEHSVPFDPGNYRKFTPEFLVEWKTPSMSYIPFITKLKIITITHTVSFDSGIEVRFSLTVLNIQFCYVVLF